MRVPPLPIVTAADMLLTAYARAAASGGSVNWEDLDLAVEYAKQENPGRYERIVEVLQLNDYITEQTHLLLGDREMGDLTETQTRALNEQLDQLVASWKKNRNAS